MRQQWRWLPALLFLALLPASAVRAQSSLAKAQTISGAVTVRRGATVAVTPLASRASLYAGDRVTTGANGSATVLFGDGSHIDLKANTSIRIVAPTPVGKGERSLYEAITGEVVNRLRPGKAVKTPSAIAGARGTTFLLADDAQGVTTLTVIEGEVRFFNAQGAVLVGESQQSTARPDAAPTAPVTIANAGLLIEWSLELERVLIPREQFFLSPDRNEVAPELQRRGERARLQPADAEVRRAHGDALFDGGWLADALREYQEADRLAPGQPVTMTRMGDTLLALGRLEEAESSYRAALAMGPPPHPAPIGASVGPDPDTSPPAPSPSKADGEGRKHRLQARFPSPSAFDGEGAGGEVSIMPRKVTPMGAGRGDPADAGHAPALVGLAWVSLTRNRPADAQRSAEQALAVGQAVSLSTVGQAVSLPITYSIQPLGRSDTAADGQANSLPHRGQADSLPHTIEARIALGLSLLRQPGQREAAISVFQAALTDEPVAYRYQAHAWLALAYLARDDAGAALREALEATRAAPRSAMAHGNLALVYFHGGKSREAEREARLAARLDPESVTARVVLGQALLASGDVDGAARAGAEAVALDRGLPEAHYLLGIADAQRRDYSHAARELRESMRLAPEDTRAAAALARVYTRMGRKQEAVTLLTDLAQGRGPSDTVLAALGGVYYEQGRYGEAAARYQQALRLKPNSALYQAELARTLLDANRLSAAIRAGEQAVRLAPGVGQYHALLGLAYDYSRLSIQAEREFRQALALDPRNALAHLALGLKAAQSDPREQRVIAKKSGLSLDELLRQGLQEVGSTPAVSSITQAFLYDPAVSDQVLRGGIRGEGTLSGGEDHPVSPALTYRSRGMAARFHSFGAADRVRDSGSRANDDSSASHLSENVTFLPDARTTLFGRFSQRRTEQGLPGPASAPELADEERTRDTLVQLAIQRRIGVGQHLWLGLSRPTGRLEISNPDRDDPIFVIMPTGFANGLGSLRQELRYRNLVPEVRLDIGFNGAANRTALLTLGAAQARLEPSLTADLFFPSTPPVIVPLETRLDGRLAVAYAQWTQQVTDRLSLAAQLAWQRLRTTTTTERIGGGSIAAGTTESHWLPSVLANYRPGERTLLRLFYNRQAPAQELTVIAFRPTETFLATEPLAQPIGAPRQTRMVEFDAERYLSSRAFVRVFLFRATADGVRFGELPTMGRLTRTGVGVRYERRLSPSLYGQIGYVFGRTTSRTPLAPFDGGTAPYHPLRLAGLALNYVSPAGTKVGLQLSYTGRFFQDTGDVTLPVRPDFPARIYVDLTLAHEPSLRYELFVKITNLFDRPAILFNDFPTGGRRVLAGATWRF